MDEISELWWGQYWATGKGLGSTDMAAFKLTADRALLWTSQVPFSPSKVFIEVETHVFSDACDEIGSSCFQVSFYF